MYYFLVLFVLFALSKELYVILEESLVAVSFVTFVLLSYNAISEMVCGELDSRAEQIRKEFQFFVSARESSKKILMSYHLQQMALFEEIVTLVELLKKRITETMVSKQVKLRHWMVAQQKAKLTALLQKERALLFNWREETVDVFSAKVVATTAIQARWLKESIEFLSAKKI